jgi:hypothetical protein
MGTPQPTRRGFLRRIPFSNPRSNQETIMSNLSGKTTLVTGAITGDTVRVDGGSKLSGCPHCNY